MISFRPGNRPDHFIVRGRGIVVLAPRSYTPLPSDIDDPAAYDAAHAALGAVLEAVLAEVDNPPPLPLGELKRDQAEAAQREQQQRLGFGFRVTVGGNEFVLSSDPAQRERVQLLAVAFANGKSYPVAGVRLYRRDGDEITASTLIQFRAAVLALEARLEALSGHYGDLIQAIRAAPDAAALAAISVTAGWPPV